MVPRPAVASSDAHGAGLAGTYATEIDRTVHTAEELAAEIRAGHVNAHPTSAPERGRLTAASGYDPGVVSPAPIRRGGRASGGFDHG